jgi:hypothetical protein
VAIMKPNPPARALYAIIRDLINTRDGATYMAARVWSINMHYDFGSNHRLVGRSVPNFEFEEDVKVGELMHNGQGMLLDFDGNASLKKVVSLYGDRIKYVSRNTKDRLGISALLIRPDGMIAWAADNEPDCNELQQAADRWFVQ